MATDPFVRMADISTSLTGHVTKPYFHPSNPQCIIGNIGGYAVFEYNLKTNKLEIIHRGEMYETCYFEGLFVDPQNHIYYMKQNGCICKLHLKHSYSMTYSRSESIGHIGQHAMSVIMPSPINRIYTYHHRNHFIYDMNTKTFIQLIRPKMIPYPKIIYISSRKELMIFGSQQNHNIWHCHIQQDMKQNSYIWKLTKWKMPYSPYYHHYDVILGFENIVFAFYFPQSLKCDIWCFHLLNHQWFQSNYSMPTCINSGYNMYVLKVGDIAHILDFTAKYHFKVDLYHLIPKDLMKAHREYYRPLIMGYIKIMENSYNVSSVPVALQTVILQYFQL